MNIYIGHSKSFDYRNELYVPLRNSRLNREHNIILPHEFSEKPFSSKEFFQNECDLMIAEVSYKATGLGLGIEMGWADAFQVPIIAIHLKGISPSSSVRSVTNRFVAYDSPDDMVRRLEEEIGKMSL